MQTLMDVLGKDRVTQLATEARGMLAYGVPVQFMSHTELLALVAQTQRLSQQNTTEHQRQLDCLLAL